MDTATTPSAPIPTPSSSNTAAAARQQQQTQAQAVPQQQQQQQAQPLRFSTGGSTPSPIASGGRSTSGAAGGSGTPNNVSSSPSQFGQRSGGMRGSPGYQSNTLASSPVTSASPGKRRDMDVVKLLMSDYKVEMVNDGTTEFYVEFHGPKDSPYCGGLWRVHVELPDAYPYKSPSIGFVNKMYHPNVDETAGSVCLDVINQTWSPMFDLINVFEVFLPQLLLYPNPSDPLNGEAAALLMKEPEAYNAKVKEYVQLHARPEDNRLNATRDQQASDEEEEDDEMSDVDSLAASDDGVDLE